MNSRQGKSINTENYKNKLTARKNLLYHKIRGTARGNIKNELQIKMTKHFVPLPVGKQKKERWKQKSRNTVLLGNKYPTYTFNYREQI